MPMHCNCWKTGLMVQKTLQQCKLGISQFMMNSKFALKEALLDAEHRTTGANGYGWLIISMILSEKTHGTLLQSQQNF